MPERKRISFIKKKKYYYFIDFTGTRAWSSRLDHTDKVKFSSHFKLKSKKQREETILTKTRKGRKGVKDVNKINLKQQKCWVNYLKPIKNGKLATLSHQRSRSGWPPSSWWSRKERTMRQVFNNTAFWISASTLATRRSFSWLTHLTCTFSVAENTMGSISLSTFLWFRALADYCWILVVQVSRMFLSRGTAMSMILTRWARLSYKTMSGRLCTTRWSVWVVMSQCKR